jgi:hypothetical protein
MLIPIGGNRNRRKRTRVKHENGAAQHASQDVDKEEDDGDCACACACATQNAKLCAAPPSQSKAVLAPKMSGSSAGGVPSDCSAAVGGEVENATPTNNEDRAVRDVFAPRPVDSEALEALDIEHLDTPIHGAERGPAEA